MPGQALGAERQRARLGLPGLALVLVRPGEAPRVDVAGHADLLRGEPLDASTPLRWYSLTKPVLAAAVLLAARDGRLALEQPVGAQLPAWNVEPSARRAHVSVLDLLQHASGLRDGKHQLASWLHAAHEPLPDPEQALVAALARHGRLRRPVGRYSNLGYATLGRLLEVVDRRPLADVLEQRVLAPWGCRRTRLGAQSFGPAAATLSAAVQGGARPPDASNPCAAQAPPLARGYLRRGGRLALLLALLTGRRFFEGRVGRFHLVRPFELRFPAHGGLVGPTEDLGRVLHGLLAVLPPDVRRRQATPGQPVGRGGESFTPGFSRRESAPEAPGQPVLYHGGRGAGFTAEMRLLPRAGWALGVVGNADFDARRLAVRVFAEQLAQHA